jgi:microcystin-dependent protein
MSSPFVAEIRIFGFNFAPTGWAACSGQLLPISQNTALFSLLGTTYGGNGTTTFALPNFQGNAPMQFGQGPGLSDRFLGETGGETSVTLLQSEMPIHSHPVGADSGAGGNADPTNGMWAATGRGRPLPYSSNSPNSSMSFQAFGMAGGGLPHNNMPPYLTLNFCIALQGIYPARS